MVLACLMFGYLAPVFWMFIEGVYLHSRLELTHEKCCKDVKNLNSCDK